MLSLRTLLLGVLLLFLLAGCGGAPDRSAEGGTGESKIYFEDVTSSSGIDFTWRNGEEAGYYSILESLGGGVALLDYDGDDRLDLFLTGGGYFAGADKKEIQGYPCRLYRNEGQCRFRDVTAETGLAARDGNQPWFYSHGTTVLDYDRDGRPDVVVTGYGQIALFRNEPAANTPGGAKFREVTSEVGLRGAHPWATSAAAGDLDGDGWPELYICQYVDWSWKKHIDCPGYSSEHPRDVCSPKVFPPLPDVLYHNRSEPGGARRFVNVSQQAGLRTPPRDDGDYGKGLGVLLVDLNGDGRSEIYVANDTSGNFLYINESSPGKLRFVEIGFTSGVARGGNGTPTGSMGVDAADYNGIGLPSLWVTNYEGELHSLYRRRTKGDQLYFVHATQTAGLAALGQNYVGFGTAFVDVDGDGWEDLVIANGHVIRHPSRCSLAQRPTLFRNRGDGRFDAVNERGGSYFQEAHRGRGLAVGDLDGDGWPDLVVSHVNEPVRILRNCVPDRGFWVSVDLARQNHADVVGACLTVELEGRRLTRMAKGGGSYLSSSSRRFFLGLGHTKSLGRLSVEWSSGEPRIEHWEGLELNREHRLVQGTGGNRP